jgi:hypothetical protein
MASANKQQKRASRAKAKAKQNRTQRAAAPVELDPNDDRIDFESVDLTELFKEMIDAQKISQQAMCAAFLEAPAARTGTGAGRRRNGDRFHHRCVDRVSPMVCRSGRSQRPGVDRISGIPG